MELITILNRCHRFRGFVYQHAHFSADKKSVEVVVRPRKGSAAVCSRCHLPAPGYDQLAERRFEKLDGHAAYPQAIRELKASGELGPQCQCRPTPYLNNVLEQDHRFVKKRMAASL
jgi:hypothetical protein